MIRAIALLAAAAAAMGAWADLLGRSVLWATVVAVVAAAVVMWGRSRPRILAVVVLAWIPFALLTAGVPAGRLWPAQWGILTRSLSDGVTRLTALGPGGVDLDPWPLAVWLLVAGAAWLAAAALEFPGPAAAVRSLTGFGLLIAPWGLAVAVRQTDEVSWQGAAIVLAVLLWFAPRNLQPRVLLAVGLLAALGAAAVAQTFGPRGQWLAVDDLIERETQFRTLDTTQTYGPLRGRRTGATMMEVTASRPGLWRMQVLERYSWRGWEVGGGVSGASLPQPGARDAEVEVRVKGLRNDMVVSPGQITDLDAKGKVGPGLGQAWKVTPMPRSGDTYRVKASVVDADPVALRNAPAPADPRLTEYTRLLVWNGSLAGRLGQFGAPPQTSQQLESYARYSRIGAVVSLARNLAAGARNQFEVVERVQRYLTEDGRFRYDTDVERTARVPLVEFLLNTRTGYCQHFAGAAALLLRLAGVPTRVAVGFATGKEEKGHYTVRDADAHAWIEVYFQGIGWVPFNPTPAAADAQVDPRLDPFAPPAVRAGVAGSAALPSAALGLTLLTALVFAARRGRRGRDRGGHERAERLLEWLTRRAGGEVTPATTLTGLRTQLTRIGPRVAELAGELERARYAPGPAPAARHPYVRIIRAVAADLGARRTFSLLTTKKPAR